MSIYGILQRVVTSSLDAYIPAPTVQAVMSIPAVYGIAYSINSLSSLSRRTGQVKNLPVYLRHVIQLVYRSINGAVLERAKTSRFGRGLKLI